MKIPVRLISDKYARDGAKIYVYDFRKLKSEKDPNMYAKRLRELSFGKTFKTTAVDRYAESLKPLETLNLRDFRILDIGSSDGSAVYHFFHINGVKELILADFNDSIRLANFYGLCLLFREKELISVSSKFFLYYLDNRAYKFFKLLNDLFRKLFSHIDYGEIIYLKNPLYNNATFNYKFVHFDIRNPIDDKFHVVIVANVLNPSYFSKHEILKALNNIKNAANDNGYVLIVENRAIERSILLEKKGDFWMILRYLNPDLDIFDCIQEVFEI